LKTKAKPEVILWADCREPERLRVVGGTVYRSENAALAQIGG